MEIPCSWPLHIRSSIANELRLTHLTRSRTLLRRPLGGTYAPGNNQAHLAKPLVRRVALKTIAIRIHVATSVNKTISSIVHACTGFRVIRENAEGSLFESFFNEGHILFKLLFSYSITAPCFHIMSWYACLLVVA